MFTSNCGGVLVLITGREHFNLGGMGWFVNIEYDSILGTPLHVFSPSKHVLMCKVVDIFLEGL